MGGGQGGAITYIKGRQFLDKASPESALKFAQSSIQPDDHFVIRVVLGARFQ